jgi:hypothetical protein
MSTKNDTPKISEGLRESTLGMASLCSAPTSVWDHHANTCLNAANRIEELERELAEWQSGNRSCIPTGIQRRDARIAELEAQARKDADYCLSWNETVEKLEARAEAAEQWMHTFNVLGGTPEIAWQFYKGMETQKIVQQYRADDAEKKRDALIAAGSVYRSCANDTVYARENAAWDAAVKGAK